MNDCAKRKDWSWQETAPDENVGSSQLEKEAGVTELYVDVREKHTFVTDWPWALRDEKRWRWLLAFAPQLVSGEAINWVRGEEGYCLGWKWKLLSRPTLRDSMDCIVSPWDCAGQNTGVGGLSFLQGIFPTQGLNPGLLHCKWILYQLSHKGSPCFGVQFSCSVVSDSLRPHELQHARPPCLSPTPGVHPNSCPSSQWGHPAISSSVVPFSSCHPSLPASESFPMSQLFAWGGQSTGVSALT